MKFTLKNKLGENKIVHFYIEKSEHLKRPRHKSQMGVFMFIYIIFYSLRLAKLELKDSIVVSSSLKKFFPK